MQSKIENGVLIQVDARDIADGVFHCKDVIEVGEAAFSGCSALTSVNLPRVTTIGKLAFSDCTNLTTLSLPMATTIGDGAFWTCGLLTTVFLPQATTIGIFAFAYCSNLISVSLPKVTAIGENIFCHCESLTTITLSQQASTDTTGIEHCRKLAFIVIDGLTSQDSIKKLRAQLPNHLKGIKITLNSELKHLWHSQQSLPGDDDLAPDIRRKILTLLTELPVTPQIRKDEQQDSEAGGCDCYSFLLNALIITAAISGAALCIAALVTAFVASSAVLPVALAVGGAVLLTAAAGTFFYRCSSQEAEDLPSDDRELSYN